MNWICQYCKEELLPKHKARHIQKKHPEHFKPQSNKGDSMCPICLKIMHKTHVKRHMISVHKADQDINIGQIKKQIVETNCSIKEFSNQCSLSVPFYWILTFIVLTKLWKIKKYVETSDVISSMFNFLKKIGRKSVGDYRYFLQSLSCYCYIKFTTTETTVGDYEQGERRIRIKHITKGKGYLQLLQQIHSNAGTFRYWQICHRMSFKTPVMRFNKEQFESKYVNSLQSDNSQINSDQSNLNSSDGCIESSDQLQIVQQGSFTTVFNQIDGNVWQFKKQFDQYCLNGKRVQSFLKKLDKFDKKEEFLQLLKNCTVCKQKFKHNEMKRLKCIYCSTQLHEQCSQSLEKCACQSQGIQIKRIFEERLLQKQYKTVLFPTNELWSRKTYQGIKIFNVSDRLVIEKEEENIRKILMERDQFIYSPQAKISKQFNVGIDLSFDPFLTQADENLANSYRMYADGSYKAPLKLKIHGKDNYGIQALETIPKMILLGEYAADIVPSVLCVELTWTNHLMLYHQGATSDRQLVLAPINICNFGPLLNHSDEGNCSSLRIIIDGSIRVLLYTTKKVVMGEELLYDYNGFHDEYPTDGFEKLND